MGWLKWMLIGLGLVVLIAIAILAAIGSLSSSNEGTETTSVTVGDRTITVSGNYKTTTQESIADGIKITVDHHVITATPGAITIDGKEQGFDPSQDIDIVIDDKGAVQATAAKPDAGSSVEPPQ